MIQITPKKLFAIQLIAHLSIVPMLMYGMWWHWCIAIFVYFLNGCLGMTMTYHRLLSHNSWNLPKLIEYLFALFATIGLTGTAISWVAVHKKHHIFLDTEKDPHSPIYKGWFWSHYLSMFAKVEVKYAAHLLRNKFYVFQHKNYILINLIYAAILYTIDPFAIVYAWLVPAMILWNAGSSIVSISHRRNDIHNDIVLSLLVWGEGYHKNHHDNSRNSKFGKWDLSGFIISMFKDSSHRSEQL